MTNHAAERTVAAVNLATLAANCRILAEPAGGFEAVMAVVKADAYGHGAVHIAQAAQRAGIRHFGIATVAEAVELRTAARVTGDLYLLSPFLPSEADALVRNGVIPFVSDAAQLVALAEAAKSTQLRARCFLTVDTGMGREGALPRDIGELLRLCEWLPNIAVTGLATHFASADEDDGADFTARQRAILAETLASLRESGQATDTLILSCDNSPAFLTQPRAFPGHRTLLRAGLLLYGIAPFRDALDGSGLEAILTWDARIRLLRDLPAGSTIGYGRTHTLVRDSLVATVGVGYADGLARGFGNRGSLLVRGRRAPIVGRVSMDQAQMDVTDLPDVALGDWATIIGENGGARQTVWDISEMLGTTPHEPTCAISRRVPRVYGGG